MKKEIQHQYFIEIDSNSGRLNIGNFSISVSNKIQKKYIQKNICNYSEIKSIWNQSKTPLFYIHGYYSATKGVTKRTVIGFDNFLKDKNASSDGVIHIIWDAKTLDYYKTFKIIEKTKKGLAHLLEKLYNLEKNQIQVMCHSMGNKLFLESMKTGILKSKIISNLILSAPDISVIEFQENISKYRAIASQIIILTHQKDKILLASSMLNGKNRLGQKPKTKINAPNFTILNCTGVKNEQNLLSKINKHFYYIASQEVRNNLHKLLG